MVLNDKEKIFFVNLDSILYYLKQNKFYKNKSPSLF